MIKNFPRSIFAFVFAVILLFTPLLYPSVSSGFSFDGPLPAPPFPDPSPTPTPTPKPKPQQFVLVTPPAIPAR